MALVSGDAHGPRQALDFGKLQRLQYRVDYGPRELGGVPSLPPKRSCAGRVRNCPRSRSDPDLTLAVGRLPLADTPMHHRWFCNTHRQMTRSHVLHCNNALLAEARWGAGNAAIRRGPAVGGPQQTLTPPTLAFAVEKVLLSQELGDLAPPQPPQASPGLCLRRGPPSARHGGHGSSTGLPVELPARWKGGTVRLDGWIAWEAEERVVA